MAALTACGFTLYDVKVKKCAS